MREFSHTPVLLEECMEKLNVHPGGVYLDCTMGAAGHSEEILRRSSPDGRLVALDQDDDALAAGRKRLAPYGSRVQIVKANFSHLAEVLDELGVDKLDGVLFDIGVSSYQLDEAERGFSYMQDAPLNMKMDRNGAGMTAAELLASCPEEELARILYEYGEEKWAKRIAKFIVERRQEAPLQTTGELVSVIKAAIPAGAREAGQHPAKRSFQAIRIAVNDELNVLREGLRAAVDRLAPGGRICIITFHSLEDRIVKEEFKRLSTACTCPPEFPVCVCGGKAVVKLIGRKPVVAGAEELAANPRSRSAKLRTAEKF